MDKGARVVLKGVTLKEAFAHALELAQTEGYVLVHPFDDDLIIAGQGTIALEMLEDFPQIDTLIVPIGGAGSSRAAPSRRKA